jgi:hypothetical protein
MQQLNPSSFFCESQFFIKIFTSVSFILFMMTGPVLLLDQSYPDVEVGSFSAEFPGCAAKSSEKWYE